MIDRRPAGGSRDHEFARFVETRPASCISSVAGLSPYSKEIEVRPLPFRLTDPLSASLSRQRVPTMLHRGPVRTNC